MAKVSSKNQVTLPVAAMRAAGLRAGDEVVVRSERERSWSRFAGRAFAVTLGSQRHLSRRGARRASRRVGALILDASVLIGLLDSDDTHHSIAVDEVATADEAGTELLTAASAYSEALVSFARLGRIAEARQAIAAMGISVTPLTAAVAEHAAELQASHDRLRPPDALVLATARLLGATLLTYDAGLARVSGASSN